jgi:hypothetical protein
MSFLSFLFIIYHKYSFFSLYFHSMFQFLFYLFFFFWWFRDLNSGLHLLSKHSTTRIVPPSHFILFILEIRYCLLTRPMWTTILLDYGSYCCWDYRCLPPCPAFFMEIKSHELIFCWDWPGTVNLLISASCIVWDARGELLLSTTGWDRVSQTFSLDWPPTVILLILASQVARITGLSHWHPALIFFNYLFEY